MTEPVAVKRQLLYLGLDVHADTVCAAIAQADGSVRELGTIRNRPEALRNLITNLDKPDRLRVCYEAGPTGCYTKH